MNVERLFFWIRLVAGVILEIFPDVWPPEDPAEGEESEGNPAPEMKPERIQVWLVLVARAALYAVDGFADPAAGTSGPEMKPERIQFWLRLIGRFVLAVLAGASGETGKSGAASQEVDR